MSATCATGTVVTTSSVAEALSSGSTVCWYMSVSASSAGTFPYELVIRVASRSARTGVVR